MGVARGGKSKRHGNAYLALGVTGITLVMSVWGTEMSAIVMLQYLKTRLAYLGCILFRAEIL